MNVETVLADELRIVGDTADVPPPPAASYLAERAARARSRTRTARLTGVALAAAAVVAAVVLGNQLGRPSSAPPPADHTDGTLRTGAPPRVPYTVGLGLYVDGVGQPGLWSIDDTSGGTTVATRSDGPGGGGATAVLRDGRRVLSLTSVPFSEVALSPDGTKVAWVELDAHRTVGRVVLHDLSTDGDLASIPVAPMLLTVDDDRRVRVIRVDNEGTVLDGSLHLWHTWKPGRAPVDTPVPADGTPLYPGFPAGSNPVWPSPDESWGAWLTRRDGSNPPPDTEQGGTLDGVTLQRPGNPATRYTIRLPISTNATRLTWESPTDLLVTVDDVRLNSPLSYLRCDVRTRRCEHAPTVLEH